MINSISKTQLLLAIALVFKRANAVVSKYAPSYYINLFAQAYPFHL